MPKLVNIPRGIRYVPARPVAASELAEVLRVLDSDPIVTCVVAARLQERGLRGPEGAGELWSRGSPADSLCFSGVNMMPVRGDASALRAFADRAIRGPRMCSSVMGRRELALPLWEMLTEHWGPAREIRDNQPLLALQQPADIPGDPAVRQVRPAELEAYFAAATAMFQEEVGLDPLSGDGGRSYRRRVAGHISAGRAWARFEDELVVFKAEVGAMSRRNGQIQGVWVRPEFRGRGLGSAGTAAVANAVLSTGRTVSLYVNDYNAIARRTYDRIGFRQVATFATAMVQ